MQLIRYLIEFLLKFDQHLLDMLESVGPWTYVFLFVIVFCETGLVVTPFLPGDSLLFAAGALAATNDSLSFPIVLVSLAVAAILGDAVNYLIGEKFGERILAAQKISWIKPAHLEKTHAFFERYGNKTIVIARFVPIVRTFAPFVAGIGRMSYRKFGMYNVVGGIAWVVICTTAGYQFGKFRWVKNNFSAVVLGIVFVSVLPIVFEFLLAWRRGQTPIEATTSTTDDT